MIVLWLAFATALITGLQWLTYERQPFSAALEALENDQQVAVTKESWLTLTPAQTLRSSIGSSADSNDISNL